MLLILFGCQQRDQCTDAEGFIHKFSEHVSKGLPSANSNYFFFLKLTNGKILKTNNDMLFKVYLDKHRNQYNFQEFLCALFQEELILDFNSFKKEGDNYQIFNLQDSIVKKDIESIKSNFCKGADENFSLRNNLGLEEKLTVLYVFFKNSYFVSYDDIGGYYLMNKR